MGDGKIINSGNTLPVTGDCNVLRRVNEHSDVLNIKTGPQALIPAPFDSGFLAYRAFTKRVGNQKHTAASCNFKLHPYSPPGMNFSLLTWL